MSYTPVSPLPPGRVVRKGKPTEERCWVCKEPMRVGQLFSGVAMSTAPPLDEDGRRTSDEGYVEGHYLCVCEMIGPTETLRAIQEGRLPAVDPRILVDGCLPPEYGGV